MSIQLGLNTAVRALITQQQALNTTAHNIANANTPGFSREDVQLVPTDPFTVPGTTSGALAGQVGTGVTIARIRRLRDEFLDGQFRLQNQSLGFQQTLADGLHQIEDFFNEPTDQGLGNELSQFFNRWRDVANDPRNQAARLALRSQAADLAAFIRGANLQLIQQQHHLDDQALGQVQEINAITGQISSLNDQIAKVVAQGDTPNDLRDRRDLLVDQLSKIARITAHETDRGIELITLGGVQLVGDNFVNTINTQFSTNPARDGFHDLFWSSDGSAVTVTGGQLRGLLDLRDTTAVGLRNGLGLLAATLINAINQQHELGQTLGDTTNNSLNAATGVDFFSATLNSSPLTTIDLNDPQQILAAAATIDISGDVQLDVNNIAAAANANAPGDSDNASAIADLQFSLLMGGGTATIEDFYRGLISILGAQGQEADKLSSNQDLVVQHIDKTRQSISGVSLDEEATKQIEFQRAFEAAARLVTMFDSMLDTLINKMGIIG